MSYRDLAERYGVALNTVMAWAAAGNWQQLREDVERRVLADLADRTAGDAVAMLEGHFGLWGDVLTQARLMLAGITSPAHLAQVAQSVKLATEGQRLARGIASPKPGAPVGGGVDGNPDAPRPADDDLRALGVDELRRRLEGEIAGPGGR